MALNIKKRYYWIAAAIAVVALIGWRIYAASHKTSYTVAYTVSQQDVKQTVLATGAVTSQSNLNLSFRSSGNIARINVSIGDKVRQGQTLAMLNESNAAASITQAKASLLAAQANYNKLVNGDSNPDINVAQTTLAAAKVAYNNTVAQQQVAVANALSAMLNSGLAALSSANNFSTATVAVSGTYSGAQGSYVLSISNLGSGTGYAVTGLESTSGNISRGASQALGTKGLFFTFSSTGTINAGDSWTINIPNTQASTYLANSNAYQTALQTQTQAVASAQAAVDSAQAQLNLKQSPPRPEDLQAAQAQVDQAQAQLQTAENAYADNIITSPIDGTITAVDTKIGETVAPQKEVLVVLDQNSLHVESDISESSITEIKAGQNIDMTLDAFGPDQHFSGTVLSIDPAATVQQGVIDYRIVSSIPKDAVGIKPGMTVNITILISDTPNVLAVPNRLIQSSGRQKFVTILRNNKSVNVNIETGAVGDNFTEVKSGLNQGDQLINLPTT